MNLVAGILAHVDAGKTTLSEALLYRGGVIRSQGRVDNKDAFLDTDAVEKERGITIYAKNARLPMGQGDSLILLDTPGHVDFSAEMERSLSVLDFAILLISAPSGVQAHTRTVWKLLNTYHVPTVIFVNKMDMAGTDSKAILKELKNKLSDDVVDFTAIAEETEVNITQGDNKSKSPLIIDEEELCENLSSCSEDMMNEYLEEGSISVTTLREAFMGREVFPCFFGSALKNIGIGGFMSCLHNLIYVNQNESASDIMEDDRKSKEFSALVHKITRDEKGNRLTYVKIKSGCIRVKDTLEDEKINEIRLYNGQKYETVNEATSGELCALVGLSKSRAGMSYGSGYSSLPPILTPVMSYVLCSKDNVETRKLLMMARELEEEDPSLQVTFDEQTKEISLMLMGDVQTEILKRVFYDRFKTEISFSEGKICYKETITMPVEGVGHFEPLRHYAEAHVRMEPLERGSGIEVYSDVSEDLLDRNWQRLIMTHIQEKRHKGVLVRGEITDIKFTVVGGRAHIKHTEGGDFRQATYRAIRQGLMELRSIGGCMLLEPYYEYTLEVPEEYVGRAMRDISSMNGTCNISENDINEHVTVLVGRGPVSTMNGYAAEVMAYTKGLGHISFRLAGYDECHNEEEVIMSTTYDPDSDIANPSGSVFCSHGAGVIIPWNEVSEQMHVPYSYDEKAMSELIDLSDEEMERRAIARMEALKRQSREDSGANSSGDRVSIGNDEIDRIIMSTGFSNAKGRTGAYKGISADRHDNRRDERSEARHRAERDAANGKETTYKGTEHKDRYILVDGYNVIHAWKELTELYSSSPDAAMGRLNDIMSNYQAVCGENIMVVYDAYRVKGHGLEIKKLGNITVVYTKEAQTADAYIERYAHENAKKYDITVVTSDGTEQVIVSGKVTKILSSRDFYDLVMRSVSEFNITHGVK